MQLPNAPFSESFDILLAKTLKDNLEKEIFEDALKYLVGSGEDQRGLNLKTLLKYNVGIGTEKFTDDSGMYQGFDSIYFPMYTPKSAIGLQSRLDQVQSLSKAKELKRVAEVEQELDSDLA